MTTTHDVVAMAAEGRDERCSRILRLLEKHRFGEISLRPQSEYTTEHIYTFGELRRAIQMAAEKGS